MQTLRYDSQTCSSVTMLKVHIFKQHKKINRHTLQKHTLSPHASPVPGSVLYCGTTCCCALCKTGALYEQHDLHIHIAEGQEREGELFQAPLEHICYTARERRGRTPSTAPGASLTLHWKVSQHPAVWQYHVMVSLSTQWKSERVLTTNCLLSLQHTSEARL